MVFNDKNKNKPWNCNSALNFSCEAIIWHPVTVYNQNWGYLNFSLLHNQSIMTHATEPANDTKLHCVGGEIRTAAYTSDNCMWSGVVFASRKLISRLCMLLSSQLSLTPHVSNVHDSVSFTFFYNKVSQHG